MINTIGYIDTSDRIDHKALQAHRIFNLLDQIEMVTSTMAHEIPEIKDDLKDWQDRKTRDIYFYNQLCKYWDKINI